MIVSQESLILEARIADDEARLAELNARHKVARSMTGDRRSRELRIIERRIRDTTKHRTEHQQRLRRIGNAPPSPGDSSNLGAQQYNGQERKEPRSSATPRQAIDKLRTDCDWTLEQLAEEVGISPKQVSRHIKGQGMHPSTRRAYKDAFAAKLNRVIEL
ncbi:MAG TPA: helix-turn-helix transcriptional regulator [Terriglobales bacterium]|jgi:AraC-like DNA-binding protein|nr:helix-turn-helix transcriptional regulator [Terriglobales bacterium]